MNKPLADQLRPKCLSDVVGQDHILGKEGFISAVIQSGTPLPIILWGPPGCGKTSIARLYANAFSLDFRSLNATFSGIAELKKMIKEMQDAPLFNRSMVLFVDEIHRFNKAQQDAFLPYIEDGTILLIGATAENPSFYLNDALLSRLRVLKLNPLDHQSLENILNRCEESKGALPLTQEGKSYLYELAQGDGRYLLNMLETLQIKKGAEQLGPSDLQKFLQKRLPLFDRAGDQHFQLISALHKSIRGSDPDAALYWFARMIGGGEDPLYLSRRLIRMAAEDIGLADPQALPMAIAARDSFEMLGAPEGELAIAEVVVYLALAPKSNAVYKAYGFAKDLASKTTHYPPPAHIINAPTKMMKSMDYGKYYAYDPDTPYGFSGQNYFPDGMERAHFYEPVERGFEREMQKRLKYFSALRIKLNS